MDADQLIHQEETEPAAAANMNLSAHYALQKDLDNGLKYIQAAMTLESDHGEVEDIILLQSLPEWERWKR
jgi:hypothetical protein